MTSIFRHFQHAHVDGARSALDHVSYLIEVGEIARDSTVGDAIRAMKQLHKVGSTHDRDWQRKA